MPKKPAPEKTPNSTDRVKAHLKRLSAVEGKRFVVDLDAESNAALEDLRSRGYGKTKREVIIRALIATRDLNVGPKTP